ncbi:MAG: cupredoxin domain-containing protein [Candidatus Berkiellales bacterium]
MKLNNKKHIRQVLKKWFLYFTLTFAASTLQASPEAPILVDAAVVAGMEGLTLTPENYTFVQGQEYLWVMRNDHSESLTFYYDTFGQKIFTHYLQGTPDVTQNSFTLPPQAKVYWLFVPSAPGEFSFYISNPSMNQKGKVGKIIVKGNEIVTDKPQVKPETKTVEAKQEQDKAPGDLTKDKEKSNKGFLTKFLKRSR